MANVRGLVFLLTIFYAHGTILLNFSGAHQRLSSSTDFDPERPGPSDDGSPMFLPTLRRLDFRYDGSGVHRNARPRQPDRARALAQEQVRFRSMLVFLGTGVCMLSTWAICASIAKLFDPKSNKLRLLVLLVQLFWSVLLNDFAGFLDVTSPVHPGKLQYPTDVIEDMRS